MAKRMRYDNPFTPLFGGKPDMFFGRGGILARFERALDDAGSEDRALFITGSRGYGKTVLLEQLSMRAAAAGLRTIDVGPDDPISAIMRHMHPYDEVTKILDPQLSVNVLGTGAALSAGSRSRTAHYSREDFEYAFMRFCEQMDTGLFLSIDEIQKASLEDISAICGAFQMASRKGYDVLLAVAGLPSSYDEVIHHDGCTFMRRAAHERLGPLTPQEVRTAFTEALGALDGLVVSDEAFDELVSRSKGHPYVMQLQGFYLIDEANKRAARGKIALGREDVDDAMEHVIVTYQSRALRPLIEELPAAQIAYLEAMASLLGDDRTAKTGEVARSLGKDHSQTSSLRRSLLDNGLILSPARGLVAFMIPYLAEYLLQGRSEDDTNAQIVMQWRL